MRRRRLALLVVATALSTVPIFAADKFSERDATITRIVRAGGVLTFDDKKPSRPPVRLDITHYAGSDKPSRFDVASLDTVKEVHAVLIHPRATGIEWVSSLPNLVELSFRPDRETVMTPHDFHWLDNAKKLEILDASRMPLTDKHMETVAKLTRLTKLDLSDTDITDEGLAMLKECRQLQSLSVKTTYVTGKGFEQLKALPKLKIVAIGGNYTTNESASFLIGCSEIEELFISGDALSDGVLRHLERMPNLKRLHIKGGPSLASTGSLRRAKPRISISDQH